EVTLVEIDREVVEVSRQYLPSVSGGAFEDPRARLRFEDGYAFVQSAAERFDVIIVDAPDPIGPGKQLFAPDFYNRLDAILNPGGIVAVQSESPLLMATQTAVTHLNLRAVFPLVQTYLGAVPAYPGTLWSYTLAFQAPSVPLEAQELARRFQERGLVTRYYTPQLHQAALCLPAFLERFLAESLAAGRPAEEHPFFPEARGITVKEPERD
ncbi:MAG TPA: hypothetical protein VNL15_00055, partial [Dehalococcoidia bacterium]|nr:hypothetical protein [Dehalococcoidia bacterium]